MSDKVEVEHIPARPVDILFKGRREAISGNSCALCGGEANEFTDALSRKEYGISGACQKCQDRIFVPDDDE